MHTTQIILEDWLYQALQTQAEIEQRSISEIVKDVLANHLSVNSVKDERQRLASIEGIGDDVQTTGRNHDDILYGLR